MAQVEKVYTAKNLKMKTFIIRYSMGKCNFIRFLDFQRCLAVLLCETPPQQQLNSWQASLSSGWNKP